MVERPVLVIEHASWEGPGRIEPSLGEDGQDIDVLHWHHDQVSLPPAAQLLASSDSCGNQAFRLGSALGLQFHLEAEQDMVRRWLTVPEMVADVTSSGALLGAFLAAEAGLARVAGSVFDTFAAEAAGLETGAYDGSGR